MNTQSNGGLLPPLSLYMNTQSNEGLSPIIVVLPPVIAAPAPPVYEVNHSFNFAYLGNDCGWIHGFLYGGYYKLDRKKWNIESKELTKQIEKNKNLCLIAFTADLYQTHAHPLLEKNGFIKICKFKSAHMSPNEYLTFWIRTNKEAKNTKYEGIDLPPQNCSVGIHYLGYGEKRMTLYLNKPASRFAKRIENSKVWYKIAKKYLSPKRK